MIINGLLNKMKSSEGELITFHNKKKVKLSFSSFYASILQAASFLIKNNFNHLSIIGIIGKNDLDWVIADLSCIYCGIKLLPLELNSDISQYQSENLRFSAILVSDDYFDQIKEIRATGIFCIKLSELTSTTHNSKDLQHHPYQYDPKDIFSFKSTSGSTGIPKIIGQFVASVENSIAVTQRLFNHTKQDRILVFLPLNLLQQRYWLYSAITYQFTIIIIPKEYIFVAIKQESPTVIMGVPYIYELIYDEFKKLITKDSNLEIAYNTYLANKENNTCFMPFLTYLGGKIRYLWTGSAPITKELVAFYFQLGIPLYQGYGMNETCIISKNYPDNNKIGSVGKLFPNINIKFDEQNQILVNNNLPVCMNYTISSKFDNDQTFLNDGLVATGDVGYIDDDGYLFINGRIKEMIALSSSKKIFPRSIEEKFESFSEIDHCVLYGDNKPYLSALIVPASGEVLYDDVEKIINEHNKVSKMEEQIYKFFIVYEKFSEKNGLLSNQNKIKRKNVQEKYNAQFEALYN